MLYNGHRAVEKVSNQTLHNVTLAWLLIWLQTRNFSLGLLQVSVRSPKVSSNINLVQSSLNFMLN